EIGLCDEARNGTEIDDGAATDLSHFRNDVLGCESRAHHVNIQDLPPFLWRRVDAAEHKDCGVIDQDINSAEYAHGFGHHSTNTAFVGGVGCDEVRAAGPTADVLGRLLSGFPVSLGNDDGGPLLGKFVASGPADSGPASRHDHRLTCEAVHEPASSRSGM